MKFQGTVEIAAPRDRVWAFVTDPNQVGKLRRGLEEEAAVRHPARA